MDALFTWLFVFVWLFTGAFCVNTLLSSLTYPRLAHIWVRRVVILGGPVSLFALLVIGAFDKLLDTWMDE